MVLSPSHIACMQGAHAVQVDPHVNFVVLTLILQEYHFLLLDYNSE